VTKQRKTDHLKICLEKKVKTGSTGFNDYHFTHQALPEINFDEIDLSCQFLKRKLNYPLLISSMTGGTIEAKTINLNLAKTAQKLKIPIIIKETGCGISQKTALSLLDIGIKIIDVSGHGGTNWALIEGLRNKKRNKLEKVFSDWGIPTTEAIIECSQIKELTIIGSGGIRTGIDMAKALVLGADIIGIALPLLQPATKSAKAVEEKIKSLIEELKITMFCLGVKNIKELKSLGLSAFYQTPTR